MRQERIQKFSLRFFKYHSLNSFEERRNSACMAYRQGCTASIYRARVPTVLLRSTFQSLSPGSPSACLASDARFSQHVCEPPRGAVSRETLGSLSPGSSSTCSASDANFQELSLKHAVTFGQNVKKSITGFNVKFRRQRQCTWTVSKLTDWRTVHLCVWSKIKTSCVT